MEIKQVKSGDIIKAPEGIRLVVYVMTDQVVLRPLDEGGDARYPVPRPGVGDAWTLLARGGWRCEPDVGWRHVR